MDAALWVAENYEDLRRRCLWFQNTGAYDGEDALQDALIYTLPYLETTNNPKGLVLKKVKRLLIDNSRGNSGYNNKCLPLENWGGTVDDLERHLIAILEVEQVIQRISRLSPVGRELTAYRMRGLSQAEIAAETGLTVGAIKGRVNRAIKELREVA